MQIALNESLDISQVNELAETLASALSEGNPVVLSGEQVTRVDASSIQLLFAFVQQAKLKGISVAWEGSNDVFSAAARMLGLEADLGVVTDS